MVKEISKKQLFGFVLAAIILVGMFFFPEVSSLSHAGVKTVGIVLAFLVILITEALPLTVICWTFLGLMPLLGVTQTFSAALTGFSNPVVFFILSSSGIAAGFTVLPLSRRILVVLLNRFGKNVSSMLFAIMLCNTVISSIVSSVPTCTVFLAISLSFLDLYDNEEDRKRAGRAFMIGVPLTSMIGGMMTPAGSSINLLAIGLLEKFTGQTITFVQWMIVGVPLTIVTLPVAWFILIKVYKPAEINPGLVKSFTTRLDISPKISVPEVRVLIITGIMLVFWILSSWFRGINIMVVALIGCCALFLPKLGVLEWKPFIKTLNFDPFFLVGTVLCIGDAMVQNGVSDWVITLLPTFNMPVIILVGFSVLLVFVMLVFIPVAPSLVTLMATPLIAMATGMGFSAPMIILTLALCAGNCYLLPLDTIPLIAYSTGYFSMTDMPKSTAWIQVFLVFVMALWIPFACGLLGM